MLQAGGIEVLTDKKRTADQNNPQGYFEYQRVKRLPQGDFEWLEKAQGKAVKIVSELLQYLPQNYQYKIVFINRDLNEVLASQAKMMERRGRKDNVDKQAMKQAFKQHLKEVKQRLQEQDNIQVLEIDHRQTIKAPLKTAEKINKFLSPSAGRLNIEKITSVVDPSLYRQRK
jgi:ElaB/YqjD/DUF883 family membrane-anchored ribosome-binding protein